MPSISLARLYLGAKRYVFGLLLPLALLSGCASQAPLSPPVDWESHQASLQQLSHYQAKGRLGYKGEQRFGANLLWRTAPQTDHLLLTNFLGKTLLKLNVTPTNATLIAHDGQTYQGTNASRLIQDLTDINLPVEQMRDWLVGLPTAADTYQLNSENRVAYLAKQIDQQLWQLDYNDYDTSVSPALPKRMILSQGDIRITLIINEWDIADSTHQQP